jgi:LysM repeat protein
MTSVDLETPDAPPVADDTTVDRPSVGVCPYLAASDGAWRSATATRDHRCGAVTPPAPLAAEKQRRLCLTAEHAGCATLEAARAALPAAYHRAPTLPRPLARTTPVALDHGRFTIAVPALRSGSVSGQGVLVALMGIAFAAIVLARLAGAGDTPAGVGGPSTTPTATAQASAVSPGTSPTSRPTSTSGVSPAATPGPGATGSATPPSSRPTTTGTQTYKVKAGDTLIGIAARFGTTPKAIAKLNGITNLASLRVGQVLLIP